MKSLILFLLVFPFIASAQFKVTEITNVVTGKKYCSSGCLFETSAIAQSWLNKNKINGSFGKTAYVKDYRIGETPVSGYTECVLYVIDQDGNETESSLIDQVLRDALDALGFGPEGEVETNRCSYPDEFNTPVIVDVTAEETAKATQAAIDAAIQQNIDCGDKIIKLIARKNLTKGLSKAQIKSIVSTYSPILDLFKSGALNSGLEDVEALTPDGILITEQDKTDIISEANGCKVVF